MCRCSVNLVYQKSRRLARNLFFRQLAALCAGLALFAGSFPAAGAVDNTNELPVTISCDHSNGVYAEGQVIHWRVEARPDALSNLTTATFAIKQGGLTVLAEGSLMLTNGAAEIVLSNAQTGTLLLEVKFSPDADKKHKALGGAVVAPERIKPSAARPDDFDSFWKSKLEELSRIPTNPQLVSIPSERQGMDYWQITMDNINGLHIHGQVAKPSGAGGKFPAMMIMEGAGVHGLKKSWVTGPAAKGWLALNLEPHDLPIDQPDEFYDREFKGALKNYWTIGNDDRDKSYFLQMYLGCARAAKYLTERPDWDGRTLLMTGTSQGGLQALMTAAINSNVTAVIANVPAGCDMLGPEVGRSPGWPSWYYHTKDSNTARVLEASRYYDIVNFASRIRCPVLASAGLIDETCPAAGILAAMNQVKGPKETVILPHSDHVGVNHSQKAFYERSKVWEAALVTGNPAPVK